MRSIRGGTLGWNIEIYSTPTNQFDWSVSRAYVINIYIYREFGSLNTLESGSLRSPIRFFWNQNLAGGLDGSTHETVNLKVKGWVAQDPSALSPLPPSYLVLYSPHIFHPLFSLFFCSVVLSPFSFYFLPMFRILLSLQ